MERCCDNCFHGHYNLSDRGEEIYCDEDKAQPVWVEKNYVCELHKYEEEVLTEVNPLNMKYNGCADSVVIADYIEKIEYVPEKTEKILKRFENVSNKGKSPKVLERKLK